MAKQSINVGATANDKKGDSLRAAFQKVNANFTELYTQLGLAADDTLNLGNFVFDVNTMRLTNANNDDSTATQIEIAQSVRIESDLTVGGDILPNVNLGGNLGSPTNQFKSLFVSNNTIFIGGTALGVDQSNNLTVAGAAISTRINYASIPNAPADVSDLTDTTDLLVDLSALTQSILPAVTETVDLGSTTKRFRDLFLSGTTIDLGGVTISTTDDGKISLPGISQAKFKPESIDDGRASAGVGFFNNSALPENSVIIDQATWVWASIGGNQSGGTFQPSVYSATFNGNGFITAISLVEANYYDDTNNWVSVNTDNLYVVPAGTLLTVESISAVGSPIGVLAAGVISTSESVPDAAFLNIPGPYADDSAAEAAGVAIGFTYHKTGTSGQVFVRLV